MRIDVEETVFRVTPEEGDDTHLLNIIIKNVASYIDPAYTWKRKELLKKFENNAYLREKWEKWKGNINLYEKYKRSYVVNGGVIIPFLRTLILFGMTYDLQMLKQEAPLSKPVVFEGRIQLYSYQKDLVEIVRNSDGCGLISAPTGSGKTIVGTEITSLYDTPTVIIADKVNILAQWVDAFTKTRKSNLRFKKIKSVYIGYIDEDPYEYPRILLCTSLFLAPYYTKPREVHDDISFIIENCGLLIYDEVHRAGSESGITILDNCQARYRIGLSGTMLKRTQKNDLEYVSRIGQMIAHVEDKELLDQKKIVPIDIHFKSVRRVGSRKLTYQQAYNLSIIQNQDRNDKITDTVLDFMNKDMKFIIFVDKIVHAQEISMLTGVEYTDSKDKERKNKFDGLRAGDIAGLICTYDLAGLGFDLPALDGLIFAGAGKSAIKFIQAKGRIARIFEGKKKGTIIDFADTSKYFDDHAYQRYRIYCAERGITLYTKGTWLHGK